MRIRSKVRLIYINCVLQPAQFIQYSDQAIDWTTLESWFDGFQGQKIFFSELRIIRTGSGALSGFYSMSHRGLSLLGKAVKTSSLPFTQYRGAGSPASTGPHAFCCVKLQHSRYSNFNFTLCTESSVLESVTSLGAANTDAFVAFCANRKSITLFHVLLLTFVYQIQNI